MLNDDKIALEEIKNILIEKDYIKHNPFSIIPKENVEEALKVLEEYSQEIKPFFD